VVVAVIGFALARYGAGKTAASPPPLSRQTSVPDFKISYPSTWRVVPAVAVPLIPMGDVLTLAADASKRSLLVIGTQQTTAAAALPSGLAAAVPPTTKPQVVTLGQASFYRYLNLTPQPKVAETVYTLPTSVGTIAAVCEAPSFTTSFTSSCERVLSTLKLTTGDVRTIGVDPGYALRLNRILGQLNDVRRSAGPGLRSSKVDARVHAASALATAHAAAATATSQLTVGQAGSANQALVTALSQNAAAYEALAHAAAKQEVSAYGRAESALTSAGSRLSAAYTQLRQLGYTIH
jgi:hypothetical protein